MTQYWDGEAGTYVDDKKVFTAEDDLAAAIKNYRWCRGWARKDPYAVEKFRKIVNNTFFKIRGFFPAEAYFQAIEAAPEGSNCDAYGMSAIRAVMEGI